MKTDKTRRRLLQATAGSVAAVALPLLPALALADERAAPTPPYKIPTLPIELRVPDLMARMTLDEKIAQLWALWDTKNDVMTDGTMDFAPDKASRNYPDGIGQITRPSDLRAVTPKIPGKKARDGAETIAFVNAAQRWAVERTRLGIPVLFHEEALHGYMAPGATSFPVPIALAGSFDPQLVQDINRIVAREMRAHGAQLALSPVVDVARDPRWGRIEETFGECPHVCAEMGVAAVTGLTGTARTLEPENVYATLKHMTGHGQPQSGENIAPAMIGERELRESFFPPFREVVRRTQVAAVMPSYNEIDGLPSHANRWLLHDVLRGEWKFQGAVVSDYGAVEELHRLHHVVPGYDEAGARALHAGVDCEMPDGATFRRLGAMVRAGLASVEDIDRACAHMLTLKFRAGLFENPYADPVDAARITNNDEARALALKAAQRSICLLKNDDGLLPLAAGAHQRIALIGPSSQVARLGGYSMDPGHAVSLLQALQQRLAGKADVRFAQGVFITQSEDRSSDEVELADPARNRVLIEEAVALARQSDLVLLTLGDTEQTSREGYAVDHLGDRTSLDLVGDQNALFDALHALGKPMVVLAANGRPPSYVKVVAQCRALFECWYLGQEGGTAMVDALFGDVNPGAKLAVTVARDVAQVPVYYNARPPQRPADYALFPFGFGLSYTRFELGAPRLSAAKVAHDKPELSVEVEVHNACARAGDEVVQLYVHQRQASVARPVLQLRGFARVTLAPGERRTVKLPLDARAFALWNAQMKEVVEPGLYEIKTGNSSRELQTVTLEIV